MSIASTSSAWRVAPSTTMARAPKFGWRDVRLVPQAQRRESPQRHLGQHRPTSAVTSARDDDSGDCGLRQLPLNPRAARTWSAASSICRRSAQPIIDSISLQAKDLYFPLPALTAGGFEERLDEVVEQLEKQGEDTKQLKKDLRAAYREHVKSIQDYEFPVVDLPGGRRRSTPSARSSRRSIAPG